MDYSELLEDYRQLLSKYSYAIAEVPVRKNEDDTGYFIDADLKDCLGIRGGDFDADYVAKKLKSGDVDELLEKVNSDGWWRLEILLKYNPGDHEEPCYLEVLLVEANFIISFENKEIADKETSIW